MPTGNLPASAKAIWEEVYSQRKKKGDSEESAAKQAWAAVKNAGWSKKQDKWVKAEKYGLAFEDMTPYQPLGPNLFRKMICPVGQWSWINLWGEVEPLEITPQRIASWQENFQKGNPAKITVPIGHAGFDDALKNTGYVRGIEYDDKPVQTATHFWEKGGAYALIEFTDSEAARKAAEGSIPDVSISIDLDWRHPETGESCGEVLEHVCVTQHPFIQGMPDFERIQAEWNAAGVQFGVVKLDGPTRGSVGGGQNSNAEGDDAMSAQLEQKLKDVEAANKKLQTELDEAKKKMQADLDEAKKITAPALELETRIKGLETTIESQKKEMEKLEADRKTEAERAERVERDRLSTFVDDLVGAKRAGAKFGLPASLKPVLLEAFTHCQGKRITLEKDGKKEEINLVARLCAEIEAITKTGLIRTEEVLRRPVKKVAGDKSSEERPDEGERKTAKERYEARHGGMKLNAVQGGEAPKK